MTQAMSEKYHRQMNLKFNSNSAKKTSLQPSDIMGSSSSSHSHNMEEEFLNLVEKHCDGYTRGLLNSDSSGNLRTNRSLKDKSPTTPMKRHRSKSRRRKRKGKGSRRSFSEESIEIIDIAPERQPMVTKLMEEMLTEDVFEKDPFAKFPVQDTTK